jgi:hypothetical protein
MMILSSAAAAGCIHVFVKTLPVAVILPATGTTVVSTPVKVHLVDGRTVLFRPGAAIDQSAITGAGESYALLAHSGEGTKVSRVPLDSVVGVETFEEHVLAAPTLVVSAATSVLTLAATGLLLKVAFGSCPTVYADTGTGPVLEAEGFSYAIAPLLEQRDLDPLRVQADADGMIRLDLRNEALETHYINNIELTAVRHPRDGRAIPDQDNRPVVVSSVVPLATATDRAGRDVRSTLAASDGVLFSTAPTTIDAARVGDLDDWIDISATNLPPGDSVAVVLRLRNSLLNTVLLYDGILGGRDAVDWLDRGLENIATAVDLGRWYTRTMGMRASVSPGRSDDARLSDVGPLAFRDVAIVLPRPRHDAGSVRIRLRFVADEWRIDYAAIAATIARPSSTTIPLRRVMVVSRDGAPALPDTAALAALREPDSRYLETLPGQHMQLEFQPSPDRRQTDSTTTYMIAWQGWYREWIRGSWLAAPKRHAPWAANDSSVVTALRDWHVHEAEMERAFYSTRIPVR